MKTENPHYPRLPARRHRLEGSIAESIQSDTKAFKLSRSQNRKESMKHSLLLVPTLLASLLAATPALADMQLANSKNCMACHAAAVKLVGPSFKDVAAKYAGQKDALDKLSTKVIKGGSGVWGPVPMPANAQVSPDEAQKLVTWILAQK